MSDILSTLQSKLLTIFRDARSNAIDKDYPLYIEKYGGQLRNPKFVEGMPALYVDVPSQFTIESADNQGNLWDMNGNPELVLFASNEASEDENRSAIAKLVDWSINSLQGNVLTIDGAPVTFNDVQGRILTDYDDSIAAAVLTLPVTVFKDQ